MSDAHLISIYDAKTALRLGSSTTYDADLTVYVAAVDEMVQQFTGPILQQNVTQVFDGGRSALVLASPAESITSVTVNGVTMDASDYTADLSSGILHAGSTQAPGTFPPGQQNVTVVYVAGAAATSDDVPATVQLAARMILRHLWLTNRGGATVVPGMGDDETSMPDWSAYAIPNRALELLAPHMRRPGIA